MLAAAQSRAIEELAEKYSDREGFTTTVIKGELLNGMDSSMQMQNVDISKIMNDITSLIVITSDKPDKQFAEDAKAAVAASGYSTIMSVSADGETIKFLLGNIAEEGNKTGAKNEFVIMVLGKDDNTLVSIVGNYKAKQVSKTNDGKTKNKETEGAK